MVKAAQRAGGAAVVTVGSSRGLVSQAIVNEHGSAAAAS